MPLRSFSRRRLALSSTPSVKARGVIRLLRPARRRSASSAPTAPRTINRAALIIYRPYDRPSARVCVGGAGGPIRAVVRGSLPRIVRLQQRVIGRNAIEPVRVGRVYRHSDPIVASVAVLLEYHVGSVVEIGIRPRYTPVQSAGAGSVGLDRSSSVLQRRPDVADVGLFALPEEDRDGDSRQDSDDQYHHEKLDKGESALSS